MDFVAVDFETANARRASVCAVGMVRVRDGEIVEHHATLLQPPPGHEEFNHFNVAVHGIRQEHVTAAPRFADHYRAILDFVGDGVVLAHNAAFDASVLRQALQAIDVADPGLPWACSLRMARRTYDLPRYTLPHVAVAAGVPVGEHHDALADATMCAQITVALARAAEVASISDLLALHVPPPRPAGSRASTPLRRGEASDLADPEGLLFGRSVVFTGRLETMTRQEAWDRVCAAGGTPDETITKRTQVLVMGSVDPRRLAPGATLTGKAAKAAQLQERGQEIEILTESEFLACLPG